MHEQELAFQVGDQVIHWMYGHGEVIQLDEKVISERTGKYYVVQIRDLTLWVPIEQEGEPCLRPPTPARDFKNLFRILTSPGEPLPTDRHMRKLQLTELLKDRSLKSVCRVIRDLMSYKQANRINESDNAILEHARNFLLSEWSIALSIPIQQAEGELMNLLEKSVV